MIETKITVKSYDVFPNSTLKPSALQQYMQQLAREDCDGMGCTYINMREVNMVFVLTRLGIRVNAPVFAYDELTVKTYNNSVSGVTFVREFEFYRDGVEVIHATTQWVIVNFDSRRIVRPKDFPFAIPELKLECDTVAIPRTVNGQDAIPCGERIVRLSDLDENDHLNNCVYSDIALDFIPFDRKDDYVREMYVIFRHEARIGEKLELSTANTERGCAIFADNSEAGQPCFEAEVVLSEIGC